MKPKGQRADEERYQHHLLIHDNSFSNIANSEVSCWYPMDHQPTGPLPQALQTAPSTVNTSTSADTPKITSKSTLAVDERKNSYATKNNLDPSLPCQSLSQDVLRKTHCKEISKSPRNVLEKKTPLYYPFKMYVESEIFFFSVCCPSVMSLKPLFE